MTKKICVAVYLVSVPRESFFESDLPKLFPRAWQRNHDGGAMTHGKEWTTFQYLVANAVQTTPVDLVRRLAKYLSCDDRDPRIRVKRLFGVPEFGRKKVTGTSRTGTRCRPVHSIEGSAVTAMEAR